MVLLDAQGSLKFNGLVNPGIAISNDLEKGLLQLFKFRHNPAIKGVVGLVGSVPGPKFLVFLIVRFPARLSPGTGWPVRMQSSGNSLKI